MKRVYFGCAIAGGRDHAHLYGDIVSYIKQAGAQVVSEMFSEKELRPEVGMKMDPAFVWKRDSEWVESADACIFEVTQPSLGVGYEIALAEKAAKPILALFYSPSGRRLSPMISGNPHIQVIRYKTVKEPKSIIQNYIREVSPEP